MTLARSRARAAVALCALAALAACGGGGSGPEPRRVPGGDAARGRRLAVSFGCGGCHVMPDVPGAQGRVGPPLERFAERQYIAGRVPNEPEALVRWIVNPKTVDPLTVMPYLGVTPEHARDIAAYLYAQPGDPLGPPHPLPADLLPAH